MGVKKVKAIELIMDWNLWPRHQAQELDQTNIRRMKDALEAGVTLPPVVVNRRDMRIVDGFHRTKAHLALYGDGAEIMASLEDFKNEGDMFLESIRLNAIQGLPLSPQDKAHAVLKARRLKMPWPAVAAALGMKEDKVKDFIERRTATVQGGEKIALPAGARHLAGKKLTSVEEAFARHSNGMPALVNARLLLGALKAGGWDFSDGDVVILTELWDHLDRILKGRRKSA